MQEDIPPTGTGELPYAVESVINASRILLMLRSAKELQVGHVADELGVARSTAHRLLTTLQSQGLLYQAAARRPYSPGPALVELGSRVVGVFDLRDRARARLEQLADETGETSHLLILRDTEVVFVDGVEGHHVIRAATRIGSRELAHASAAGKVLLAELPDEDVRRRYPEDELSGGTTAALRKRSALLEELERVRSQGYAINNEESESGLCAVSVAVHDTAGNAIGAISVSGPSGRMGGHLDSIVERMLRLRSATL